MFSISRARIVLAFLIAFCIPPPGLAAVRLTDSAPYALTPEEATLLFVYGIPHEKLRTKDGAYHLEGTGQRGTGPSFPTLMRVQRNQGCRVEIENSAPDRDDIGVTNVETLIYDWSKVDVDKITVSQEIVPNQGYEAYYRTILAPGRMRGLRVIRRREQGAEVVQPGVLDGTLEFRWAYAPGRPNAYAISRQPLIELLQRCTGRTPKLPEADDTSRPYRWTTGRP